MGPQDQKLRQLARSEHDGFSVLLPPAKQQDKAVRNTLYRELLNVYKDALELHSIFMKSKAFFEFDWISQRNSTEGKVLYAADSMEADAWVRTLDTRSVVVFSISPGLSKAGTANGFDYDQKRLLVKPRVVCN